MSTQIQKMLDTVRVVGNNAIHAAPQIDDRDSMADAQVLFKIINLICEKRISEPKEISELYDVIVPQSVKEEIAKRDSM